MDLFEAMAYFFVKEFAKAVLGLALVLGIVVFLWWINTED